MPITTDPGRDGPLENLLESTAANEVTKKPIREPARLKGQWPTSENRPRRSCATAYHGCGE